MAKRKRTGGVSLRVRATVCAVALLCAGIAGVGALNAGVQPQDLAASDNPAQQQTADEGQAAEPLPESRVSAGMPLSDGQLDEQEASRDAAAADEAAQAADGNASVSAFASVGEARPQQEQSDFEALPTDEELPAHEDASVLAQVAEGISLAQLQQMLQDVEGVDTSGVSEGDLNLGLAPLTITDGTSIAQMAEKLETIPGIDGAQPNYRYTIAAEGSAESKPADLADSAGIAATADAAALADLSAQMSLNDPDAGQQWGLESVNAPAAWDTLDSLGKLDADVSVAVIDTGVQVDHEDLKGTIKATHYISNSDTSKVDSSVTSVEDVVGHGTHVAGIVSAEANNGVGVAGVSYNAGLVAVKASLSDTDASHLDSFDTASLYAAYKWLLGKDPEDETQTVAEKYNVKVINMSIGAFDDNGSANTRTPNKHRDEILVEEIDSAAEAGILTVCAAGNNSKTHAVPFAVYPGDCSTALSVINLTTNDDSQNKNADGGAFNAVNGVYLSNTSNYNVEGTTADSEATKDISAPGTAIYSTVCSGLYGKKYGNKFI